MYSQSFLVFSEILLQPIIIHFMNYFNCCPCCFCLNILAKENRT